MTRGNAPDSPLSELVKRIRAAPLRFPMSTKIVAVDGPGGSGKSTLAARLSLALDAPIVHTDDFASWDIPMDWWPRLLSQVLEPLSANESAHFQRYDWNSERLEEWHEIPPTPYLILEGVSASREAFRPYICYSIWVETPRDERLRRGLERDGMEMYDLWLEWIAAEDLFFGRERLHLRADVIVDGTEKY